MSPSIIVFRTVLLMYHDDSWSLLVWSIMVVKFFQHGDMEYYLLPLDKNDIVNV